MSHWADNVEWFDSWILNYARKGNLGPEIQGQVERGELEAYQIWPKLKNGQLLKVGKLADEDFWESKFAAAEARSDAERENFHE